VNTSILLGCPDQMKCAMDYHPTRAGAGGGWLDVGEEGKGKQYT